MSRRDNAKLLDNGGEWIFWQDDKMGLLNNKVVMGFLQDSHYNVIGFAKNMHTKYVEIPGYACSHFRLLNDKEIEMYCKG